MTIYNGVTTLDVQGADGCSSIQIMVTEIEGGDFGIGITARKGIELRCIGTELKLDAARELYESLGAYLQRQAK